MGRLHEILAVEASKEGIFKKLLDETLKVFGKQSMFQGAVKTTKLSEGELDTDTTEHMEMTTTVAGKLEYLETSIVGYLDTVLQKDTANQDARADIIVDGVILAKDVPAVNLLGMESKLAKVREVYSNIPTLAVGMAWDKDPQLGKCIHRARHPEVRAKTAKRPQHRVLYDATTEHPAQIEKWNEDVRIGTIKVEHMSGMLTSEAKSSLLARLDRLLQAVKQARMRANMVEAKPVKVGKALLDFVHGNDLE
jgi:hypothetical protein